MRDSRMRTGALLTMLGGALWGFSGTCGQFLLQSRGWTSGYLVPLRLMAAGLILVIFCAVRRGREVLRIFKEDALGIIIFAILGMSACQYTYYQAIAYSNAGTATVLQYTGPVMILCWTSLRQKRMPRPIEVAAIVLAMAGTYLLATHGRPGSMALSPKALFWGLVSAVSLVVYTVQPVDLLNKYGSPMVTGWGMLIGGVVLSLLFRPWTMSVRFDGMVMLALTAIIALGSITAFTAYLEGVRRVGPKKGSLYASVEPVSATLFSTVMMGSTFEMMDLAGFACIISTIFLLAADKKD